MRLVPTGVNWHSQRSANVATGPRNLQPLNTRPLWELPPHLSRVGFDHNSEAKCSSTQETTVSEECKLLRGHEGQGWLKRLPVSQGIFAARLGDKLCLNRQFLRPILGPNCGHTHSGAFVLVN